MKKKKEITMWAIWSPYIKTVMINTAAKTKRVALEFASDNEQVTQYSLKAQGYRAVKGKFVWEEK